VWCRCTANPAAQSRRGGCALSWSILPSQGWFLMKVRMAAACACCWLLPHSIGLMYLEAKVENTRDFHTVILCSL